MNKKYGLYYKIFFALAILLPLVIALTNLYQGSIPFWYDPARDLLMGLDTHQKISLIGQTSGIPGIFYGPYWIWFLSLALFISHDPRIVIALVLTLPYFILFPLLLFKFKKQFGTIIPLLLWLLFSLSFGLYMTQLWNPNPAPLVALLTIYLLVSQDYQKKKWKQFIRTLAAGLTGGLLMNLHISFGLVVILGSYLFLLLNPGRRKTLLLFTLGIFILFLPFFTFELRHGFNQINTILTAITSSSAVVKETSVDKVNIVVMFFSSFAHLLQIPLYIAYWVFGLLITYVFFLFYKKKVIIDNDEKKMLTLIGSIILALFCIYLSTKNPVWEYHFIGVEILFLLLIGFLAKKDTFIKYLLVCWIIVLAVISCINYVKGFSTDRYKISTLATKEHIVDIIYNDAGDKSFSVHTFNPTQFTPDFDYLLLWKGEGKNSKLIDDGKGEIVYLIIPGTTIDLWADFIDNRTPNEKFKTVKTWDIADNTDIIKRIRYEKK